MDADLPISIQVPSDMVTNAWSVSRYREKCEELGGDHSPSWQRQFCQRAIPDEVRRFKESLIGCYNVTFLKYCHMEVIAACDPAIGITVRKKKSDYTVIVVMGRVRSYDRLYGEGGIKEHVVLLLDAYLTKRPIEYIDELMLEVMRVWAPTRVGYEGVSGFGASARQLKRILWENHNIYMPLIENERVGGESGVKKEMRIESLIQPIHNQDLLFPSDWRDRSQMAAGMSQMFMFGVTRDAPDDFPDCLEMGWRILGQGSQGGVVIIPKKGLGPAEADGEDLAGETSFITNALRDTRSGMVGRADRKSRFTDLV